MPLRQETCIHDILFRGGPPGNAIAIEAPGRLPLSYERLREQVSYTVKALNAMGYGRNDRIAVVLPNGPEMAVAFLSVSAGFTCVPLNSQFQRPEFENYLASACVKGLVALAGARSPATDAAGSLGIPVIELSPGPGEAGLFMLYGRQGIPTVNGGFAAAEDIALVLYTSGTTSHPKRVTLTQRNICFSAACTSEALRLTESDRCLNIMPLFYIHGLVGALLSSMSAGASVICTPGFIAPEFPAWLEELQPTWYTAAPTIHQKVLECTGVDKYRSLRLIRSAAAPLPEVVRSGLEKAFSVPVIEAYGMTEAYQIASNPLPPQARKPGSVGIATGTAIMTIDEAGNFLPEGSVGEIVIRGPNVMNGYENNPEENKKVFINGWLRTGDLGHIDGEGYLFITGRIKEIINRGGEKISPYEVEEIILTHPGVRECAVFPVPDPSLGEEAEAAVVLRDGSKATADDIRDYLIRRMAYFKVPSKIFIVEELPKSSTGKIQRLNFAEKLGLRANPASPMREYVAPVTATEQRLAGIWAGVLRLERVSINDDFFDIGGDSLLAALAISRINEAFQAGLPLFALIEAGNIANLGHVIDKTSGVRTDKPVPPSIVTMKTGSIHPPLFCIHTINGALAEYRGVVKAFKEDRTVIGVQAAGMDGTKPLGRIESMAAHHVSDVLAIQPSGPYLLLGYSSGGVIAYEMARQLRAMGHEIGFLGLVDSRIPNHDYYGIRRALRLSYFKTLAGGSITVLASYLPIRTNRTLIMPHMMDNPMTSLPYRICMALGMRKVPLKWYYPEWVTSLQEPQRQVAMSGYEALSMYIPKEYNGNAVHFISHETRDSRNAANKDWSMFVRGGLETFYVPGEHHTMMQVSNVEFLARYVESCLEKLFDTKQETTAVAPSVGERR